MAGEVNERDLVRLEKKLDLLTGEIKLISEELIRLSTSSHQDRSLGAQNSSRLNFVEENLQQQNGALKLFKLFSGIILSSFVGFGTWIVTDSREQTIRINELSQKVAVVELKLSQIENQNKR